MSTFVYKGFHSYFRAGRAEVRTRPEWAAATQGSGTAEMQTQVCRAPAKQSKTTLTRAKLEKWPVVLPGCPGPTGLDYTETDMAETQDLLQR